MYALKIMNHIEGTYLSKSGYTTKNLNNAKVIEHIGELTYRNNSLFTFKLVRVIVDVKWNTVTLK